MSYSDVSECENHHSGCWHLPRTQRVGNMEDIEDDDDDGMPFEREVSLDEIQLSINEHDKIDILSHLTQISKHVLDQQREKLLKSKKIESTDFNICLEGFLKSLTTMEEAIVENIKQQSVVLFQKSEAIEDAKRVD